MSLQALDYHAIALENSSSLLNESPIFQALLMAIIDYYQEQQLDLIWLSENLLDIDNAKGWQLDLIGLVLNQPRLLASFDTGVYFGFEGAYQAGTFGTLDDPTVGAPWFSSAGYNPSTSKRLSDDQYRRILKARSIKTTSKYCNHSELLEIVNLLSDSTNSTIDVPSHGNLTIYTNDPEGFVSYFLSRSRTSDNILPIPLGVKVTLLAF